MTSKFWKKHKKCQKYILKFTMEYYEDWDLFKNYIYEDGISWDRVENQPEILQKLSCINCKKLAANPSECEEC